MSGIIIFLSIIVAILASGNVFLYISLHTFFGINNPQIEIWMIIGLIVSSMSFIFASITAHYAENIAARTFYSIAGLSLALWWNILMACVVVWGVIGSGYVFGFSVHYVFTAICTFTAFGVYSGYGIWSAFHPVVTHVTLEVKDLSDAWESKTAVLLSDIHLGHTYGTHFLTRIVDMVNDEHPDIVFIAGDLFDGMNGALRDLVDPLTYVKAKDGMYFITGNHETYLGVEKVFDVFADTLITILDDEVVHVDGMQIVGVSFPMRGEKKDFTQTVHNISDLDLQKPAILLYHEPSVAATAKAVGFDVQLAGHTHRGQIFPFQLITYAIYGRYAHAFFHEDDFSLYTSRGVGTWGPAMRTSGRPEIVVINFFRSSKK